MISFTILYPFGPDKKFDWDYYLPHHMEKIKQGLGPKLLHYHLEKGLAGSGENTPPAFFAILHLLVESMAEVKDIADMAPVMMADIPNYTDVKPIMQISESIE